MGRVKGVRNLLPVIPRAAAPSNHEIVEHGGADGVADVSAYGEVRHGVNLRGDRPGTATERIGGGVAVGHVPEVTAQLVRQVRIHADYMVVAGVRASALPFPVVLVLVWVARAREVVRQRLEVQKLLAERVGAGEGQPDSSSRNNVARVQDLGGRVGRARLVDGDQHAVGIEALREISRALEGGRYGCLGKRRRQELPREFLGSEEEQLALAGVEMLRNENRPAIAPALHVEPVGRPVRDRRPVGVVRLRPVVPPRVGVEFLVPVGPPAGAMEFLRAALGHQGDGAAGVPAELSLVVGGQNLDFLYRVHVGVALSQAVPATDVHVCLAVNGGVRPRGVSIDVDAGHGVSRLGVARGGGSVDNAGHIAQHPELIAAADGDVFQFARVHQLGMLAAGGLHWRGVGRNRYVLHRAANRQHDVAHVTRCVGFQGDVLLRVTLEPRCADCKRVRAG